MKKITRLLFALLILSGFNYVQAQGGTSSDQRLPKEILTKLGAFHFADDSPNLTGTAKTKIFLDSGNFSGTVKVKYNYNFTLLGNKVKGVVSVEKKQAGQSTTTSFTMDFPVVLQCCKQSSGELCFDPGDAAGIANATKNGCTGWYKKVVQ